MASVEVRDPIHGLITFSTREWQVVDTRAFQRLRGVQQLALTNLVYPGARHSRFEHCIGAAHVAGRLAQRLRGPGRADLDAERVRMAALVHDIGHGPFSHVSEEVFEFFSGGDHVHEKISAAIVRHDPAVSKAIGKEDANWIAELLAGEGHGRKRSVERDIIAGPADIDKLDYLLRDSHFCGVNYGRYDLDKMVETARTVSAGGETYLAFHEDGLYALEEMLLARYHMHRQVYGHKTRVGIDRMLVRAMMLGVEEGVLPVMVFNPPAKLDKAFVVEYLSWDDARVTSTLCDASEKSTAGKVMGALVDRKLCKRVERFDQNWLQGRFGALESGLMLAPEESVLRSLLREVEATIASAAGVDPCWVVLHWEDRRSPLSLRYSLRTLASDIIVTDDKGATAKFYEQSEVFTEGEQPGRASVSLYLRPKGDRPLSASVAKKVHGATLAGLERIAQAGAEV
jgi:HD superfamily phosphohydrolase